MAGKGRNAIRIETDIEKSREESNWKRVIELAEQLKAKSANQGKSFVICRNSSVPIVDFVSQRCGTDRQVTSQDKSFDCVFSGTLAGYERRKFIDMNECG